MQKSNQKRSKLVVAMAMLIMVGAQAKSTLLFDRIYQGEISQNSGEKTEVRLSFHSDETKAITYLLETTKRGALSLVLGRAEILGGSQYNPWLSRVRLSPLASNWRRDFQILDDSEIEQVGPRGETLRQMRTGLLQGAGTRNKKTEMVLFKGMLQRTIDGYVWETCEDVNPKPKVEFFPSKVLLEAIEKVQFSNSGRIYAEVFGQLDSEGRLVGLEINRASQGLRCATPKIQKFLWAAEGSSPKWFTGQAAGRVWVKRTPNPMQKLSSAEFIWQREANNLSLKAQGQTKTTRIQAQLIQEVCVNPESKTVYGFKAQIQYEQLHKKMQWQGCGWLETLAKPEL